MKKALKITLNQAGKKHALVDNGNGTFAVYVLCANYCSYAPGGIAHTWRVSNSKTTTGTNLTLADANALFTKRIAGKKR